ncbi:hypothetical protein [Chitinophaga niastensis]|nr:hypothetical protein [Chitinophaga niastensis]
MIKGFIDKGNIAWRNASGDSTTNKGISKSFNFSSSGDKIIWPETMGP